MAIGNTPVYLAMLLAVGALIFSLLHLRTKEDKFVTYARFASLGLFLVVSGMLLYLYHAFITSNVSIRYVWEYSHVDHELKYKISGVLAGMAGSLLFWIWCIALPWVYTELRAVRRPIDRKVLDWSRVALMGVVLVLLLVISLHDIFEPTAAASLANAPDGNGLNPLLQTNLMVTHPPVVFLAYGFLVLPFAAGFANLITGKKDWIKLGLNWSRAGWLFLTLGIGLGGLWAYVVLGWGGYWAWDPVETSSFLPWLLLTGFMHAQLMNKRKGDYEVLAPLMGIFTFLLVVFATFATRAGGLWVSVHTFGQADTQVPPMERFMDILKTSDMVLTYFVFMLAVFAIALILALRRARQLKKKDSEERLYTLPELVSDRILMLVAVYLSIVVTLVTMLILVSGVNGLSADDFDVRVGALVLGGVVVLVFCLVWRQLGRKWVSIVGGGALFAGLVGYMGYPAEPLLGAAVPILAVGIIFSIYKVVESFNVKRPWRSMRLVSAHIIHFAVVLILVGYVASTYTSQQEEVQLVVGGPGVEVQGYTIQATGMDTQPESIFIDVEVYKDGKLVGVEKPGIQLIDGQVRNEIRVVDSLAEDVYITYVYDQAAFMQGRADFQVKVLPLMKCLWGGMWLMAIGIVIRVAVEKTARRKEADEEEAGEPEEELSDEDERYDALLEEELAEMDDGLDDAEDEEPEEDDEDIDGGGKDEVPQADTCAGCGEALKAEWKACPFCGETR